MRRFAVSAMIAVLLGPSLPALSAQPASCCCRNMSRASCPMRAQAMKGCHGGRSCSMDRPDRLDLAYDRLPTFLMNPTVLVEMRARFMNPRHGALLTAAADAVPSSPASPPDPPPPRMV